MKVVFIPIFKFIVASVMTVFLGLSDLLAIIVYLIWNLKSPFKAKSGFWFCEITIHPSYKYSFMLSTIPYSPYFDNREYARKNLHSRIKFKSHYHFMWGIHPVEIN